MSYPRTGCAEDRARLVPEPGERFGSWTFLCLGEGYRYKVRCECGVEAEVRSQDLRSGGSSSCGCTRGLTREVAKSLGNRTHGKDYGDKLYRTWRNAKNRCFNPNAEKYKSYGAEGITMHPEWAESFEAFASALGPAPTPTHSLDRIDTKLGYVPGNIRWASVAEQALNKKTTLRLVHQGVEKPLKTWCEELGLDYQTAAYRLRAGAHSDVVLAVGRLAKGALSAPGSQFRIVKAKNVNSSE